MGKILGYGYVSMEGRVYLGVGQPRDGSWQTFATFFQLSAFEPTFCVRDSYEHSWEVELVSHQNSWKCQVLVVLSNLGHDHMPLFPPIRFTVSDFSSLRVGIWIAGFKLRFLWFQNLGDLVSKECYSQMGVKGLYHLLALWSWVSCLTYLSLSFLLRSWG